MERLVREIAATPRMEAQHHALVVERHVTDLLALLADLGATRDVARVLDWYGDLPLFAARELLDSHSPEAVRALLERHGHEHGWDYLRLAQRQRELGWAPEEVLATLETAFEFAKVNKIGLGKGYADLYTQREIAVATLALGFPDQARRMADTMAEIAAADDRVFPWTGPMDVAATYLDLGLPAEARAQLEAAEALLPESEDEPLARGVVWPVYTMRNMMGPETHTQLAVLRHRLGDEARFREHLVYFEEAERNEVWMAVLRAQPDAEAVLGVYDGLPEALRAELAVRVALELWWWRGDDASARRLARWALREGTATTFSDHRGVARVAAGGGDARLLQDAATALAEAALAEFEPRQMAQAAEIWATCLPELAPSQRL